MKLFCIDLDKSKITFTFAGVKMSKAIKLVEMTIKKMLKEEQTGDIKADVQKYLDKVEKYHAEEWKRLGYDEYFPSPTFETNFGKTWIKVIEITPPSTQRSVHCFIDMNGNLYKAASWNAPAKGKRGSIYDAKPPLGGYDFYR